MSFPKLIVVLIFQKLQGQAGDSLQASDEQAWVHHSYFEEPPLTNYVTSTSHLSYIVLPELRQGKAYCPHFTDEKAEIQGKESTPRPWTHIF